MSDDKKTECQPEDSMLNELLDSALEDLNTASKSDGEAESETFTPISSNNVETPADDSWTKDFIKQTADQFEKNLQNFMQNGADNELGVSLQKMAQTVATAITDGESVDSANVNEDFQSAVSQALKDLSVMSENLQSDPDLTTLLGQASLDESDISAGILPFMTEIMQTLLSKEVLYPSLKEMLDKYPKWLEEKSATLPNDDLNKYTKQYEIIQKVCNEFEKEKDSDSENTKKQRFETILSFMQEMQTYGSPPEDLVGIQPTSIFQFDSEGNPVIPSLPLGVETPQNCCLM